MCSGVGVGLPYIWQTGLCREAPYYDIWLGNSPQILDLSGASPRLRVVGERLVVVMIET